MYSRKKMSKNTQKRAKQTDAGVDGDTTDRNLAQSETKIVFENETGEEKKNFVKTEENTLKQRNGEKNCTREEISG